MKATLGDQAGANADFRRAKLIESRDMRSTAGAR
jgi:hypothetical protein